MDTFNADRKKLEAQVVDAVDRLAQHMGTGAFIIPLKDGTVIAAGLPEEVVDLAKAADSPT